jgi:hypothetical protein
MCVRRVQRTQLNVNKITRHYLRSNAKENTNERRQGHASLPTESQRQVLDACDAGPGFAFTRTHLNDVCDTADHTTDNDAFAFIIIDVFIIDQAFTIVATTTVVIASAAATTASTTATDASAAFSNSGSDAAIVGEQLQCVQLHIDCEIIIITIIIIIDVVL